MRGPIRAGRSLFQSVMELSGKVALVTGAARRVGHAIALALAARGVAVAVHYRNSAQQAAETVATIEARGGTARAFHADLERVADIESMVNAIGTAFGRLDILVNSAAVFYRKPLEDLTEPDWDTEPRYQLEGAIFCGQVCGRDDAPAGRGENHQYRGFGRNPPI